MLVARLGIRERGVLLDRRRQVVLEIGGDEVRHHLGVGEDRRLVVGGIIAVPVIGALQLRMDKRLSEKSFLSLMKMSIAQLPVIGGLVKK